MNNDLAPIVLFVYNRPQHTQKTLEALQKNTLASESELFVYSDAPRNAESVEKVRQVRDLLKSLQGFKSVTIVEREKNWGLANSVIDGVTSILQKFPSIIVLEDDLVASENFLAYMNAALTKYKGYQNVFGISGYSHSNDEEGFPSTYFLKLTSSWGWATWADKWKAFCRDDLMLKKILQDSALLSKFNFDNSFDFVSMAQLQLQKKIDSWAIYWYASVFLEDGLTLYPCKSLLENIGFDGSGVHCENQLGSVKKLAAQDFNFTDEISESPEIRKKIGCLFAKPRSGLSEKIVGFLKRCIQKCLPAALNFYFNFLKAKLRLLAARKRIGKGTFIDKTVNVFGWKHIRIGENTLVGEGSWLNVNSRVENHDHIIIGNYCYIGRRNLISSSKQLIINDYVMTSNECKFLGSNHVFENPWEPYILTGTTDDGILKVGANTWVGAAVIVVGNVQIGHGSIIGAGSVVTKNIPPFSIAVGNPCKVIKRFNFKESCWQKVEDYNKSPELELLIPSEEDYIAKLRQNSRKFSMPVMAATSKYGDLP